MDPLTFLFVVFVFGMLGVAGYAGFRRLQAQLGATDARGVVQRLWRQVAPVPPAGVGDLLVRAVAEIERQSLVMPGGSSLMPNRATILAHPDDHARLVPVRRWAQREVAAAVLATAERRGAQLLGVPVVRLVADATQAPGCPRVVVSFIEPEAEANGATRDMRTRRPAEEPTRRVDSAMKVWTLRSVDEAAVSISLERQLVKVGRNDDCDVVLTVSSVSRYHAELTADGAGLRVRDLGSSNGTWLNGRRVTDEAVARAGDELRFGPAARFRLEVLHS